MTAPTVMVSSTFYDLQQIRQDLRIFLTERMGYQALMSEFASFPVDPDADTVANCCRRVEEQADVLVLVVGGRYGSIDLRTDLSVTNLEYLQARKKGIPVYAFVEKRILTLLPVWQRNPKADYGEVVDTPRLFTFVHEIRTQNGVWTFPFETAQDIVQVLGAQLAYLFLDSLRLRHRLVNAHLGDQGRRLTGPALRLLLEKPTGWEQRLFLQTWIDEIDRRKGLLWEYQAGLNFGLSDSVDADQAASWIRTRLTELTNTLDSFDLLINTVSPEAFGPPGQPGDSERIIWIARKIGELFETSVTWCQRVKRARVAEPFSLVARLLSQTPATAIDNIATFPQNALPELMSQIAKPPELRQQVAVCLDFHLEKTDELDQALRDAINLHLKSERDEG